MADGLGGQVGAGYAKAPGGGGYPEGQGYATTRPCGGCPGYGADGIDGRPIGVIVVGSLTVFSGYMPFGGVMFRSCGSLEGFFRGGMCDRL